MHVLMSHVNSFSEVRDQCLEGCSLWITNPTRCLWGPLLFFTSGRYKRPSGDSLYLFPVSSCLYLLLLRQASLSQLYVAELRVRMQHWTCGSLISLTCDHSSRSTGQNSLKADTEPVNSPQCPLYSNIKRWGRPNRGQTHLATVNWGDPLTYFNFSSSAILGIL